MPPPDQGVAARAGQRERSRSSSAILLFARSPEAEAAAKRLNGGERLFEAIAGAWIGVARECGVAVILACSPEHRASFRRLTGIDAFVDQSGSLFGERLAAAARGAFSLQFDHLLITGIDAPPPDAAALDAALSAVEDGRAAAVAAPSTDGGINFLVVTPLDVSLLETFTPRDSGLIARCRRHFRGRVLIETAALPDLDSREVIRVAFRQSLWRPYRRFLRRTAPVRQIDAPAVRVSGTLSSSAGLRAPPFVAI